MSIPAASPAGIPTLLDHIVVAGPDLSALVAWFATRTGVSAAPGGRHPTGTANALVALTVDGRRGAHYIELIGPDPAAAITPTTFGIDRLTAPTVVTYAVHPDDIDATVARARAAGFDPGDVVGLSRRRPDGTLLSWRLTPSMTDGVPFLIDWGGTAHPGLGDIPTIELVAFSSTQPDAEAARRAVQALGLPAAATAAVDGGAVAGYTLTVAAASGPITL